MGKTVLLAMPSGPGSEGPREALEALGHKVVPFDYVRAAYYGKQGLGPVSLRLARAFGDKLEAHAGRKLAELVDRETPDVVLVQKGELIPHETIRLIRETFDLKAFVWHVDAPWASVSVSGTADNVWQGLRHYDVCFACDSGWEELYRHAGVQRFEYLPVCIDPGTRRPVEVAPAERARWGSAVAYAGNRRPRGSLTHRVLRAILRSGLDLKVWGGNWGRDYPDIQRALQHRYVWGTDLARVYCSSDVALNVTAEQAVNAMNVRVFEAGAFGRCLLTDHRKDLERHFDVGKDLESYRTPDEAATLAKELLADPERRARMGASFRAKILAGHTFEHRMKRVMSFA